MLRAARRVESQPLLTGRGIGTATCTETMRDDSFSYLVGEAVLDSAPFRCWPLSWTEPGDPGLVWIAAEAGQNLPRQSPPTAPTRGGGVLARGLEAARRLLLISPPAEAALARPVRHTRVVLRPVMRRCTVDWASVCAHSACRASSSPCVHAYQTRSPIAADRMHAERSVQRVYV